MKLFIGAGLGVVYLDTDGDLGDDSDSTFAYQAIGGLSYAFTPDWAATLTYTYFAALDPELNGADADYDGHNVVAGIRYNF